jgi:prophage regulatory protein
MCVQEAPLAVFQLVRVLRKPDVAARCGLGKSTVDQMVRKGLFPAPIQLTRHAVGWRIEDVDDWLERRQTQRMTG